MKKTEHIEEATAIGRASYGLINFNQLPATATAEEQVRALQADRQWQEMHAMEIGIRLDKLMAAIRRGDE